MFEWINFNSFLAQLCKHGILKPCYITCCLILLPHSRVAIEARRKDLIECYVVATARWIEHCGEALLHTMLAKPNLTCRCKALGVLGVFLEHYHGAPWLQEWRALKDMFQRVMEKVEDAGDGRRRELKMVVARAVAEMERIDGARNK